MSSEKRKKITENEMTVTNSSAMFNSLVRLTTESLSTNLQGTGCTLSVAYIICDATNHIQKTFTLNEQQQ